jgi:hypothetical protein
MNKRSKKKLKMKLGYKSFSKKLSINDLFRSYFKVQFPSDFIKSMLVKKNPMLDFIPSDTCWLIGGEE